MLDPKISKEAQDKLNEQLYESIFLAEDPEYGHRNQFENFPLKNDHLKKVEALLQAGADPNYISDQITLVSKCTFIERAIACPDYKLYQLLLKYNATLFRNSEENRRQITYAVSSLFRNDPYDLYSKKEDARKIAKEILSKSNVTIDELRDTKNWVQFINHKFDFYQRYTQYQKYQQEIEQKRLQEQQEIKQKFFQQKQEFEQKRQRIKQKIVNIQKQAFNYVQFIYEHKTALFSIVMLTASMAFYFGFSPMFISFFAALSFAATLGFQLKREKIANKAFKDLLDKNIIIIEPNDKNTKIFQYNSDILNDKYYLKSGFDAAQSWSGYVKCPWTLPGKNNNLVQGSRKMFEIHRQIATELGDEKKKAKSNPKA